MDNSRRRFLTSTSLGALGAAAAASGSLANPDTAVAAEPAAVPTGPATPVLAPAAEADVSAATFAVAQKLVDVSLTESERIQAAGNWRAVMAPLYERRTGSKHFTLGDSVAPASRWDPRVPGQPHLELKAQFVRRAPDVPALPRRDDDIAFAPVTHLARWIETRQLTSERLTRIYLDRVQRFDGRLRCIITLLPEQALNQARQADQEIAAGHYRGALHGIPWGGKDLLDTAGIPTTYGAEPYRDRVPTVDAHVVRRLHDAGAVLMAKLSMGALALNDVWFGGQTMNPWLLEEGASGSSAGPGSATAAALVGFSIGSETGGSIISPSMRCGVTGLRPTFGRVGRSGAMTLCWSLDKLGPMTRSVEDAMLVLEAIAGDDPGDAASLSANLDYDSAAPVRGLRVGYFPEWMRDATDVDRRALEVVRAQGMVPVEVSIPDWPYNSLNVILFAESAAAFEELTLGGKLDSMKMQTPDAWPNTFRQSRFLSAVDFVQADRMRRKVAVEMARVMTEVDLLLVPSLRDEMLTITNFTGHPSLTLRAGFIEVSQARSDWAPDPASPLPTFSPPRRVPYGVTLIGRLFDEGTLGRVGRTLESAFGVAAARPAGF